MKKIILLSLFGLSLSACTTMQNYKKENDTPDGYRFKYGPMSQAKLGDKIIAFEKTPSATARKGYSYKEIGKLTVVQVAPEYTLIKKDQDFKMDETIAFVKE
jgi:hypothetical protein